MVLELIVVISLRVRGNCGGRGGLALLVVDVSKSEADEGDRQHRQTLVAATNGDRGILLFTSDDTPIVRKYIAEGKVAWTICQDPHMQGYMAIRKMQDYFISGIRPDDYITQHVIKIRESYS